MLSDLTDEQLIEKFDLAYPLFMLSPSKELADLLWDLIDEQERRNGSL